MPVRLETLGTLASPESITKRVSSMVMEVSAMLVARMTLRLPAPGSKTRSCSSRVKAPYSGNTRTSRRPWRAMAVTERLIASSPGKNVST